MPFSEDDKVLIKKFTLVQRLWFTKVISRISYENWTKGGLGEESEGNWKY